MQVVILSKFATIICIWCCTIGVAKPGRCISGDACVTYDQGSSSMLQSMLRNHETEERTADTVSDPSVVSKCGDGNLSSCNLFDLWCMWNAVAPCVFRGHAACEDGVCKCNSGATCKALNTSVISWNQCVDASNSPSPFFAWPSVQTTSPTPPPTPPPTPKRCLPPSFRYLDGQDIYTQVIGLVTSQDECADSCPAGKTQAFQHNTPDGWCGCFSFRGTLTAYTDANSLVGDYETTWCENPQSPTAIPTPIPTQSLITTGQPTPSPKPSPTPSPARSPTPQFAQVATCGDYVMTGEFPDDFWNNRQAMGYEYYQVQQASFKAMLQFRPNVDWGWTTWPVQSLHLSGQLFHRTSDTGFNPDIASTVGALTPSQVNCNALEPCGSGGQGRRGRCHFVKRSVLLSHPTWTNSPARAAYAAQLR